MFSKESGTAIAKTVVHILSAFGDFLDYYGAQVENSRHSGHEPTFFSTVKLGFCLVGAIVRDIFFYLMTAVATFFRQWTSVMSLLVILLILFGAYRLYTGVLTLVRRWRGKNCEDVMWGPVEPFHYTSPKMCDAVSQTDSVLSLSLVAPVTREFYDYFHQTLSKTGMQLVNKIIHSEQSTLELPRPRPLPGPLPLFAHTLDKKPPKCPGKRQAPPVPVRKSSLKTIDSAKRADHLRAFPKPPRTVELGFSRFCVVNEVARHKCHVCDEMFVPKPRVTFDVTPDLGGSGDCYEGDNYWDNRFSGEDELLSYAMLNKEKDAGVSAQSERDKELGVPPV